MQGLKTLETLLARRNQRFRCVATGQPQPGPDVFTAQIVHYSEPPHGPAQCEQLNRLFPDIPQLAEFYAHYSSVRLFVDPIGGDSAFYIASPDEWHGLKSAFEMWTDGLNEEDKGLLPVWLDSCLVIGEIPTSGNYFLMPTTGEHAGKVFLFDHDGFEFSEQGADLSKFIERVSTVDETLLQEIPGHTRYADGETDTQWLAREYSYDQ